MLTFDTALTNALKNRNTTAFWVLKLYYNDESAFIGVSDRHRQDGTDIYYGLVASWSDFRQSLDFFNFTTSIGNIGVTLINTEKCIQGDRFSDLLSSYNFANRKWELFLNTNETTTLDTAARMIGTGIISGEITYDENNVVLTLFDNSSKHHKRVPVNTVDSSTYTNAPANNVGKPIPMAYGDFHAKTDIGTIPTSNFDRFYNFYKGAFPAIITDEWDVQEEGSEALADSQAINTMDNENVYVYKNGYYPTLTGTVDVTGNPEIEYKGSTASVYLPISTSNIASASGSGSYSVANASRISDGDFSAVATWEANGADTNNSDATLTFALPKINKLGVYSDISALIKWGTVTNLSGSGDVFSITTKSGGGVSLDSITSDSETKTSLTTGYTATRDAWDFEGDMIYTLESVDADESAQIYESGMQIDFTIEEVQAHIEEITISSPITQMYSPILGPPVLLDLGYAEHIVSASQFAPSQIDYVYYSGKGRQYGAYIDADSRDQGYTKDALIENPVFIIESILRSELGVLYSGSATSTTSNKLVDSGASFATSIVGQTVYNLKDKTSAMVTARDSGTTLSIDANIMASGEGYIISGLTSDEIDYDSFDTSGDTSDGYLGDIYEDAVGDVKFAFSQYKYINSKDLINRLAQLCLSYIYIGGDGKFKIKTLRRTDDYSSSNQTVDFRDITLDKIGKTSLGNIKNSIVVKYNHDYGAKQNLSEATATDSTSQGTTVNGYNQTMKFEIDVNEILDSTTATKLAEAYLAVMKDRKDTVDFTCMSPKYNHMEIGDIIDFSNWNAGLKIYGSAMSGYFIISDITKRVNGCTIKSIKVS